MESDLGARSMSAQMKELCRLVFGIACLGYALYFTLEVRRFQRESIRADAVVIAVKREMYKKTKPWDSVGRFIPVVRFEAAAGLKEGRRMKIEVEPEGRAGEFEIHDDSDQGRRLVGKHVWVRYRAGMPYYPKLEATLLPERNFRVGFCLIFGITALFIDSLIAGYASLLSRGFDGGPWRSLRPPSRKFTNIQFSGALVSSILITVSALALPLNYGMKLYSWYCDTGTISLVRFVSVFAFLLFESACLALILSKLHPVPLMSDEELWRLMPGITGREQRAEPRADPTPEQRAAFARRDLGEQTLLILGTIVSIVVFGALGYALLHVCFKPAPVDVMSRERLILESE